MFNSLKIFIIKLNYLIKFLNQIFNQLFQQKVFDLKKFYPRKNYFLKQFF